MKLKLSVALVFLALLSACTRTNNTIAPTNTVTVTLYSGTANAENITFNSIPGTGTLATGTPFIINGTGYQGSTQETVQITLNNPNCSYPNFVSGSYTLCGKNPDSIFTNHTNCAAGTDNHIQVIRPSCTGCAQGSFLSATTGTVDVQFNAGVATGTFKYASYRSNGAVVHDSSLVTGSFSVRY